VKKLLRCRSVGDGARRGESRQVPKYLALAERKSRECRGWRERASFGAAASNRSEVDFEDADAALNVVEVGGICWVAERRERVGKKVQMGSRSIIRRYLSLARSVVANGD
jgi:hypothetical protein